MSLNVVARVQVGCSARAHPAPLIDVGIMGAVPQAGSEPEREAIATVSERSATTDALCVCGHPRAAHQHLRKGTECTFCGAQECARFRRRWWWRRFV